MFFRYENIKFMNNLQNGTATQPGEPRQFSDEELEQGFTGAWAERDPRWGLEAEKAWKARRDAHPEPEVSPQSPKPPRRKPATNRSNRP